MGLKGSELNIWLERLGAYHYKARKVLSLALYGSKGLELIIIRLEVLSFVTNVIVKSYLKTTVVRKKAKEKYMLIKNNITNNNC